MGIGRYFVLAANGFTSNTYLYFYFFSDALLIISLYFVLMSLYVACVLGYECGKTCAGGSGAPVGRHGAHFVLHGLHSTDKLVTYFVMEMSQNLYFVGVVLTYVLWGAMMKLRENRSRLMQLVLSMGVYFSAFAGSFALGNLYPDLVIWRYVSHLMVTWLPISWAYHVHESQRRRADGHLQSRCAHSMMRALIATLIFAISPLALLQFFVSYCHSLITKSRGYRSFRARPRSLRPHCSERFEATNLSGSCN